MVLPGAPVSSDWHVERKVVGEIVYSGLKRTGRPRVVGLVGGSGSGKTTAALQVAKCPQVREYFSGGILWLSVGADAKDRLPSLMQQLSQMVHEGVMGGVGSAPTTTDDHVAYVSELMDGSHGGKNRCLLVADNVCEREVIAELKKTGMWILLTSRSIDLVISIEGHPVQLDKMCQQDAQTVLRRAADCPPPLPAAAGELVELCGRSPMDLEFVGKWSTLNGNQKERSWSEAAAQIRQELAKVGAIKGAIGRPGAADAKRRMAVFCAAMSLSQGSTLHQELFLALAVLPDGYEFSVEDACILLYDERVGNGDISGGVENQDAARVAVVTLERWGILSSEGCNAFRINLGHAAIARERIMCREEFHKLVVGRWVNYISSLDAVRSHDVFALVGLWKAAERVGADGWRSTRPYEDALANLDTSDATYLPSVEAVALLYEVEGDHEGAAAVMRRVLDLHAANPGVHLLHVASALRVCIDSVASRGKDTEERKLRRQLEAILDDPAMDRWRSGSLDGHPSSVDETSCLFILALCSSTTGRNKEAESLCRQALASREAANLSAEHPRVAFARHMLGCCMREAGRPADAEKHFRLALEIEEARLGRNHVMVAVTLYELGRCVREDGRPAEAVSLYKRALEIEEAKLGSDDGQVAFMLYGLGRCVWEAGRPAEAVGLFRRALAIEEAKLGPNDQQVAFTLYELGRCEWEVGRVREAEGLFRRALTIEEAKVGPEDLQLAVTLDWLGICLREGGRPAEAGEYFQRALSIRYTKLGPDDVHVALTLHELGRCVREAGRPQEAQELFRRALVVREAKLGPKELSVAVTLHELGRCDWEMGRPEKAEAVFRRALEVEEANLGPDDVQVAFTLHEIGLCVREVGGRMGEAERFFRRALAVREANLGSSDIQVALTLHELGRCVREAGRPGEAEHFVRRALQIREKKLRHDDVQLSVTLHELGWCVRGGERLAPSVQRGVSCQVLVRVSITVNVVRSRRALRLVSRLTFKDELCACRGEMLTIAREPLNCGPCRHGCHEQTWFIPLG